MIGWTTTWSSAGAPCRFSLDAARRACTVVVATVIVVAASFAAAPSALANSPAGAVAGSPRGAAAAIAAGWHHTCSVGRDGQVRCWGSNEKSATGAAAASNYSNTPRQILLLPKQAWAVVAGYEHTSAILNDHSLTCWGDATHGKLGTGYTSGAYGPFPVTLPGSEHAQQLALGTNHTCALMYNREISCWGSDQSGQLGNDDPAGDVSQPPAAVSLPGNHTATAVTAGDSHTCAILDDGSVTCWGSDQFGQLGNGPAGDRDSPTDIVTLPGGHRALAVSAGLYHTCAILDDGTVTCWGRGDNGRLGGGGGVIGGSQVPIPAYGMPGGQRATAITAGYAHTCALLANGGVSCWGLNNDGQLGTGDNAPLSTPSAPLAMPAARAVVIGQLHTCAVLTDDRVTCWGRDDFGQLGNGVSTDDVLAPPGPIIADLPPYVGAQIVDGGTSHTCAVSIFRHVYCWGSYADGRLGLGAGAPTTGSSPNPTLPVALPSGRGANGVALGESFTCAILDNSTASCWGLNSSGQLGTGASGASLVSPSAPLVMPGGRSVSALVAGNVHACALLSGGLVACWGADFFGQVGNGGGLSGSIPTPTLVNLGNHTATDIAAGANHTCVILDNGQVSCWGSDSSGQLGNGAPTANVDAPGAPMTMPTGLAATAIAAGDLHTCVVLTGGTYSCWGYDGSGQLGNGPSVSGLTSPPAAPTDWGLPASSISAGGSSTCLAETDGNFACFGSDSAGQMGDAFDGDNLTPVEIPQNTSTSNEGETILLAMGSAHVCIVMYTSGLNDILRCWGSDSAGQVGNGAPNVNDGDWTGPRLWLPGELEVMNAPAPPGAPGQPAATGGVLSAGVTWPQPENGADHYVVQASSDGGATWGAELATVDDTTSMTVNNLAAGQYRFRVAGINSHGAGPWSVPSSATTVTASGGGGGGGGGGGPTPPAAVPLDPARVLETRPGLTTADGRFQGIGRVAAHSVLELDLAGRLGVPANASAAFLNVTAVIPSENGYLTVFPCGTTQPNASNVNYATGQVVPNAVLAKIGVGGKVCIFSLAATDIVIDVNGYVPAGGSPDPLDPARVLETRPGLTTADGRFQGIGRVAAHSVLELDLAGRLGVPANASAAFLNVTAVIPSENGYLTVFPCGTTQPNASNVNYATGQVVPNAVLAKIGAGGKVCIFSLAATDIVIDVNGYLPAGGSPIPLDPARVLETRPGLTTADGRFQGIGRVAAHSVLELDLAGRLGVPANASAAFLNVTAVVPSENGYLTVFPCGTTQPNVPNVNYAIGQVVPNAVLAKIGTGGKVCIFSLAATDIVIDVNGYIPAT